MVYTIEQFYGEDGTQALKEFRENMSRPGDFRPVILHKETSRALKIIIEYCWTTDFDEYAKTCSDEEPGEEVFAAMLIATDWITSQPRIWWRLRTFWLFIAVFLALYLVPEIVGQLNRLVS